MINNHVHIKDKSSLSKRINVMLSQYNNSYDICAADFNTENEIIINGLKNIQLQKDFFTAFKNRNCTKKSSTLKKKALTSVDKILISLNLCSNKITVISYYDNKTKTIMNDNGENLKNGQPFCDHELSLYNTDNTHMCAFNTGQLWTPNNWPSDHALLFTIFFPSDADNFVSINLTQSENSERDTLKEIWDRSTDKNKSNYELNYKLYSVDNLNKDPNLPSIHSNQPPQHPPQQSPQHRPPQQRPPQQRPRRPQHMNTKLSKKPPKLPLNNGGTIKDTYKIIKNDYICLTNKKPNTV